MSLVVERRLAIEELIAERIMLLEEQILSTEVAEGRQWCADTEHRSRRE
jgi:hypothetical protein